MSQALSAQQDTANERDTKDVYGKMWKTFSERRADEYAAHLVPYLRPHVSILDLGCGQGSITVDLARLVPEGSILGVDVNSTLIEAATKTASEQGIANLEYKVMDANDLSSLASDSFDVIHEHQVLLHLPDPIAVLKELRRILKPGGILGMRDNAILHYFPLTGLPNMAKYIHVSLNHCRVNGRGIAPKGVFFGIWAHLGAVEAGFERRKMRTSSWGWSWPDPKAFVETAKTSARPMLLSKGLMTESELDDAEKEWDVWAEMPGARMQGLDGAVLCWK